MEENEIISICKEWSLEDHITLIKSILDSYIHIRDDYNNKINYSFKTVNKEFDTVWQNKESEIIYRTLYGKILPSKDIELQYYLPGITEKIYCDISLNFRDWEPKWNFGHKGISFKIRDSFDIEAIKDENYEILNFDKLGDWGKYITLIIVDNQIN